MKSAKMKHEVNSENIIEDYISHLNVNSLPFLQMQLKKKVLKKFHKILFNI